jgi:hypothetical protein
VVVSVDVAVEDDVAVDVSVVVCVDVSVDVSVVVCVDVSVVVAVDDDAAESTGGMARQAARRRVRSGKLRMDEP